MENIEKVFLGVIGFIITSTIAYLFRMRQLYVALPRLYSHAPLSKNGVLAEIIVYNRGNQVEEQIQIEIDQSLKVDLIASSSAEIVLDRSLIKIDRLHKLTEQSVVLLIEEGSLSTDKIKSISSKAVKGRVVSKVKDVPGNHAMVFVIFVFLFSLFPGMYYGFKNADATLDAWVKYRLSEIANLGWNDLNRYYYSDISKSYHGAEFPLVFVKQSKDSEKIIFIYNVLNKTALPLEVTALKSAQHRSTKGEASPYYSNVVVPALSAQSMEIKVPLAEVNDGSVILDFSLEQGDEFVYNLNQKILLPSAKAETTKQPGSSSYRGH